MLQNWEYKSLYIDTVIEKSMMSGVVGVASGQVDLDALGNKGWELVAIVPLCTYQGTTVQLQYTFKRPTN